MEIQGLSTDISSYQHSSYSSSSSKSDEEYASAVGIAPNVAPSGKPTSSDSAQIEDILELSGGSSSRSGEMRQAVASETVDSSQEAARSDEEDTVLMSADGDVAELSGAARKAAWRWLNGSTQVSEDIKIA
ncbi:MAG: hypothetical protein H6Q60_1513 [Oscillospiraceae bacterium]|nr:hypothetical protein [Oscillospiraceae bacterium]